MGAVTHGNLRVSLPPDVTDADVEAFLAVLPRAIAAARDAGEQAAR
jgi:cysteine desulfurase